MKETTQETINRILKEKKITLKEVSEKTGLSQQLLLKLKNGQTKKISKETLYKLINGLDIVKKEFNYVIGMNNENLEFKDLTLYFLKNTMKIMTTINIEIIDIAIYFKTTEKNIIDLFENNKSISLLKALHFSYIFGYKIDYISDGNFRYPKNNKTIKRRLNVPVEIIINNQILGNTLKRYRKENNLTLHDISNLLQIKLATISRWETGKLIPDLKYLLFLCKLYKIKLSHLLDQSVSMSKKER